MAPVTRKSAWDGRLTQPQAFPPRMPGTAPGSAWCHVKQFCCRWTPNFGWKRKNSGVIRFVRPRRNCVSRQVLYWIYRRSSEMFHQECCCSAILTEYDFPGRTYITKQIHSHFAQFSSLKGTFRRTIVWNDYGHLKVGNVFEWRFSCLSLDQLCSGK